MKVPVLTAVTDAVWEAELVQALERTDLGVAVVRRCVDLADLLATAAAGTARAALLSADLRRLDRDALDRLAAARVAVVGLVTPGDEEADRRLRQLGVLHVLPADAGPQALSEAVVTAVDQRQQAAGSHAAALADPAAALPDLPPAALDTDDEAPDTPLGRLVAVWGPTGAPGRTTVATTLASELAGSGVATLLIDADVYGGVVSQVLGLLDEAPGLAAACRFANTGSLDVPRLAEIARTVSPSLRVLTGIARADRWPELRPASLEVVLTLARRLAAVTVLDCGFCLEQDEELAYDTAAPRRNGATLTAIEQADTVIAVGAADPVGLQRLVRGLADLREAVPDAAPEVVLTRLRKGAVPGQSEREVKEALARYAGVHDAIVVPYDRAAHDAATSAGRTLAEVAPGSPARAPLQALAARLGGVGDPAKKRRRFRQRLA